MTTLIAGPVERVPAEALAAVQPALVDRLSEKPEARVTAQRTGLRVQLEKTGAALQG